MPFPAFEENAVGRVTDSSGFRATAVTTPNRIADRSKLAVRDQSWPSAEQPMAAVWASIAGSSNEQ